MILDDEPDRVDRREIMRRVPLVLATVASRSAWGTARLSGGGSAHPSTSVARNERSEQWNASTGS